MKTTKKSEVWLIIFGVILLIDISVTVGCIYAGVGIITSLTSVLNCINIVLCFLFARKQNSLELQRDDLQRYKDIFYKYHDYNYDQDNTHGYYGVEDINDAYWVHKYNDDCTNYIVKVFKFDPADENSKAEAKAKAEELWNLITEGETLWRK